MVPGYNVAAGVQADKQENQGRDERCCAKEVDTLEGRFGGMFDGDFDGEEYYEAGDDSKWHSEKVPGVSKFLIRYADYA